MKKIFITRKIPEVGIQALRDQKFEVDVSPKDRPLLKKELIKFLKKKPYDAVLTLLTDQIDAEVMNACPTVKIFANFAIGFNNFDIGEAKKRGIFMTNTPGGGAWRVSEHTWALILALTCRVVEGDELMRSGKYKGWDPNLLPGTELVGKTLGIIGTGKIGADVARKGKKGFGMNIVYYDIVKNTPLEEELGAVYYSNADEVLKVSDIVSLHVPLNEKTRHLINKEKMALMKKTAYLVNTSRGPVVDETALADALRNGTIKGAGLDVFEFEPKLAKGLAGLSNVVMTPHIASATEKSRREMAETASNNIIEVLNGNPPINPVQ